MKIDPEAAPLPSHIPLAEATAFMSSVAKGDRSMGRVIGDTARQVLGGMLPGKGGHS